MRVAGVMFDLDDFEPLSVKVIECAACIGRGLTLMGEVCTRCEGDGRLGSAFWRGGRLLGHVLASPEVGI